jgi:predicted transposase YdaD
MMRESRIYQEILEEGRQEGELAVIFRQLARRIGQLPPATEAQIRALSLSQLEALEFALLNFAGRSDLDDWLKLQ